MNHCWDLSDGEIRVFVKHLNHILEEDPDCKHKIPIPLDDKDALASAFEDGILMCKVILKINPVCLDERAIDRPGEDTESNVLMGIMACKANDITMTGIHINDFTEKHLDIILCFIW